MSDGKLISAILNSQPKSPKQEGTPIMITSKSGTNKTETEKSKHIQMLTVFSITAPWFAPYVAFSEFGLEKFGAVELGLIVSSFFAIYCLWFLSRFPSVLLNIVRSDFLYKWYCGACGLLILVSVFFGVGSASIADYSITPKSDSELSAKGYEVATIQAVSYPELLWKFKRSMDDGKLTEKEFTLILDGRKVRRAGKRLFVEMVGK